MKILYAASNRKGASLQLNRFLKSITGTAHQVKIAAYRDARCIRPIDWILNALLDMLRPERCYVSKNSVLETYYDQVKYFSPDLIVSDLEPFTSHIAEALNIPIWQVSPLLLYPALVDKVMLGVKKNYAAIFNHTKIIYKQIQNFIYNADRRLIYSHLGDTNSSLRLKNNFEWVRPYHIIGEQSIVAHHNIVALAPTNYKNILRFLNKKSDIILFANFIEAKYSNMTLKNIDDVSEYACNLRNCNYFINQGFADLIADAFYNQQFSWVIPDFTDAESVINAVITEHFKLGKIIYDAKQNLSNEVSPSPQYDLNINFLSEQLEKA
jgi:uncharacterized protein (TIGR00661 family)